MTSPAILGIGLATPPLSIDAEKAAKLVANLRGADTADAAWASEVQRASTVRARASVLLEKPANQGHDQTFYSQAPGPTTRARIDRFLDEAPPLARRASERALRESETEPAAITDLITVSCTGFGAPGVDTSICRDLGLSPTVRRTNVGFMGCHGAINALRVAEALVRADAGARVLISATELCTLHLSYSPRRDAQIANSLFADGSAAAVIGAARSPTSRIIDSTASVLIPETSDLMSWRIGDHGFEMTLSPRVPIIIERALRPWLDAWLATRNLTLSAIGSWAVHPGGPRILDAVEAALDLSAAALAPSRDVLSEHGNMSSPTVLFILDRLRRAHTSRPTILLAFGPGLTVEGAMIK